MKTKLRQSILTGFLLLFALMALSVTSGAEEAAVMECQDSVTLLQNGDYVTQYFGNQPAMITDTEDTWQTAFRMRVKETIAAMAVSIDVSDLNISRSENLDELRKIYRSCITGDCFFLSGGFSYSYNSAGYLTSFRLGYYSNYCSSSGEPDTALISADLAVFHQNVNAAIAYVSAGRNTLEVAMLAHDWIVRECDYAYEEYLAQALPKKVFNAYGVFVDGRAVCNGYAIAYSYILSRMGIESYVAASDSMNHAWNLILVDGTWYHADTTYDDPVFGGGRTYYGRYSDNYSDEGFVYHLHFMKSDEEVKALGYYDWNLQNSEIAIPTADRSGTYAAAVFADQEVTSYVLASGTWYFSKGSKLYQAQTLLGDGLQPVSGVSVPVYYAQGQNNKVYFTDFTNIYVWTPSAGLQTAVTADSISEFAIKKNQLVYVTTNGSSCVRSAASLDSVIVVPDNSVFVDISETDYFYDAVIWAYENGITSGVSANMFAPEQSCTRGQVVTFLWRAKGQPEPVISENPFSDVCEGDYFYKAVLWAYENGITSGLSATEFGPGVTVDRSQVVTFMWRDAGMPACTGNNPFMDVSTGIYYHDAVLWAYENGVTAGLSATEFGPESPCTRGQVVTFLHRALGN